MQSLTRLVKNDAELRRKICAACIAVPALKKRAECPLLVEPRTARYGLVGHAIDYLFCFMLERINGKVIEKEKWVAENVMASARNHPTRHEQTAVIAKGDGIVAAVKELREKYIRNGKVTKELIRQVIRMAYIDTAGRSGMYFDDIGKNADPADIDDVREQFLLLEKTADSFRAKKTCILNPDFHAAFMRGVPADADAIVDDMLVEIKSTKKIWDNHRRSFCQVIGYVVLNEMEGKQRHDINRLGFYYSRYGYFAEFALKDVITGQGLASLVKWFEDEYM